jgi:hypothetical protein
MICKYCRAFVPAGSTGKLHLHTFSPNLSPLYFEYLTGIKLLILIYYTPGIIMIELHTAFYSGGLI